MMILAATHISSELGSKNVPQIVARLHAISSRINALLRNAYTAVEIQRSGPGGGTGIKEALLYILVRELKPAVVIETGVAQGISSTFILSALEDNGRGRLISIDLPNFDPKGTRYVDEPEVVDPVFVKKELGVGWLVPSTLRNKWTLILQSSRDALAAISEEPGIFLHDSLHSYTNMMFEFSWAWSHLLPGGILIADDISWNDAFIDFKKRVGKARTILDKGVGVLQKDPDLSDRGARNAGVES